MKQKKRGLLWDIRNNPVLYLMALPVLLYFLVFKYLPMGGIYMAFTKYTPKGGIFMSPFVGLQHFKDFFGSYYFVRLLKNTLFISVLDFAFTFPAPILFALLLNEVRRAKFKKVVQTISYMPYFISLVVICGLIREFTGSEGFITAMVSHFTGDTASLLTNPKLFRPIYIASNVWQRVGFDSIIYLAALSGVDQELYEAAALDGAGRLKQTLHITLPCISTTIIILLILRVGSLLDVGFEKIILLYSPITYETADVISSFTYRKGLIEFNYGYSTAVGLFNSVINFILLSATNFLSRRISDTSLF